MLFIGICGASGSGKSTLAESLATTLGERCIVLQQDCYYRDFPEMSFEDRVLLNYDEPSIFDHDLLLSDIQCLMNGQSITRKRYDYSRYCRNDTTEIIQPPEVLILEGVHSFYDQRLVDKMYLRLYMQVEPDICLLRRIQRDIQERGREIDGISAQYLSTVKPMYDQYVKHYVHQADVIVAHGGKNARIVDILTGYVMDELHRRDQA